MRTITRIAMLWVLGLLAVSPSLGAEVYPTKPVRVIVPFAPGGSTDFAARAVTLQLAEQFGTSFVIDNRAGASGTIGYGITARSAPDGYTLGVVESSFAIVSSLNKSLPFNTARDFTPITLIMRSPAVVVVSLSLKVNTLQEFVALARANPGKFNYGSAGVGAQNHLAAELFKIAAKVDLVHVPFKGGAGEVITAMMSGQVQMLVGPMSTVLGHVRNGRVRALAVATDGKRTLALPEVPSMSEAGVSGMTSYSWVGFAGPAGVPRAIVNKLHAGVVKALAVPTVSKRFITQGAELVGSTPEEFSRHIRGEMQRWSKVVKTAAIKPE